MKKKLLALLATFFLQTPVNALMMEVTVLTKGNLTVYLYGDTHNEYYARQESINTNASNADTWFSKYLPKHALFKLHVNFLEAVAKHQVKLFTDRVALLENEQGENITVILEQFPQLSQSLLETIKQLLDARPTSERGQLCTECNASLLMRAKKRLEIAKDMDEKAKTVFSIVKEKLSENISTMCVDNKRERTSSFMGMISLLRTLYDLKMVGVDTSEAENIIYEEMGATSLNDLGIETNMFNRRWFGREEITYPLYSLVTLALDRRREAIQNSCARNHYKVWNISKSAIKNYHTMLKVDDIQGLLREKFDALLTTLEDEALEQIRALEEIQEPSKVVLFAGASHTRNLENMLWREGFAIWHRSFVWDNPERAGEHPDVLLRQVNFDVLDTAQLELIAPRPTPPPAAPPEPALPIAVTPQQLTSAKNELSEETPWWWELPRIWLYSI